MGVNEYFEFYNKYLNLDEHDFIKFKNITEIQLPSTFRITNCEDRETIISHIKKYDFIQEISYLKDVYTFNLVDGSKYYKEFMDYLICQTTVGNIQRQEIVSMLPVYFLDVQSENNVLETCAAPGSKTKQILEILKDGLLVSNDKSVARCNVLVSEASKKSYTNFLVTRLDASQLPNTSILFDKICCDVPCSSDGTMRKAKGLIEKWNIKQGIGLHYLQHNILSRALDLLSNDGLLAYSTCSLSPIENECVINRILETGNYEIVDQSAKLQYENKYSGKIIARKGITSFSYEGFSYENTELSKCIRIMPQDQNTGGFFIAIIRRKNPFDRKIKAEIELKLPKNFFECNQKIYDILQYKYCLEQQKLIANTSNFNNIYAISKKAYDFLCSNPKIKFIYAGIKAFSKSDLEIEGYRSSCQYLTMSKLKADVFLAKEKFQLFLNGEFIDKKIAGIEKNGHFIVEAEGIPLKFCGFGGKTSIFIYIDKNRRKSIKSIHFN